MARNKKRSPSNVESLDKTVRKVLKDDDISHIDAIKVLARAFYILYKMNDVDSELVAELEDVFYGRTDLNDILQTFEMAKYIACSIMEKEK